MTKNEAAIYLDELTRKLNRVKTRIITATTERINRALPPDRQYALRIIESAIRELNRCFQIDYGENADLRAACLAEQRLARRDRGEILEFMGRKHGVGRFNCTACDAEYVDAPFGGLPVRKPTSRLCRACGAGVQHSALATPTAQEGVLTPTPPLETAPEPILSDVGACERVYLCDNCGAQDTEWVKVG